MQTYPYTQYNPYSMPDLSDPAERKRLSSYALKAFFNIISCWKVRDEEARKLLGGIGNATYYAYKKDTDRVLEQDKLIRISYLTGIFRALNILHSKKLADQWINLPNSNHIFAKQTPLSYMIKGGIPAMQVVRRLLDARQGGR